MPKRTYDAISRSDRVLVAALGIVLATVSAAAGASLAYRPSTDKVVAAPAKAAPAAQAPAAQQMPAAQQAPAAQLPSNAVMAQLLREHRCLAEVMYYEARGEGRSGQKAIAEVVFHRMNHGNYGHSICAVVYEGAGHPGCQFSFACNGSLKKARQPRAWYRAEVLAARILTGEVPLQNTTGGATSFHAASVTPEWAGTLERTTQIGNHVFYRGTPRTRAS
jgi:spore germination cell wall hydrolase CwlJ-like protein